MPAKKKSGAGGAAWRKGHRTKTSDMEFIHGKVFVAMKYSEEPEKSKKYQAIVRACQSLRLHASRVDEAAGSGPILFEVFDSIEQGEFLIFDLTKGSPNVYYELGYAHGVGNRPEDIILIAKKGSKIYFDVLPLRIIYYTTSENLEKKLRSHLKKLVSLSRRAHSK